MILPTLPRAIVENLRARLAQMRERPRGEDVVENIATGAAGQVPLSPKEAIVSRAAGLSPFHMTRGAEALGYSMGQAIAEKGLGEAFKDVAKHYPVELAGILPFSPFSRKANVSRPHSLIMTKALDMKFDPAGISWIPTPGIRGIARIARAGKLEDFLESDALKAHFADVLDTPVFFSDLPAGHSGSYVYTTTGPKIILNLDETIAGSPVKKAGVKTPLPPITTLLEEATHAQQDELGRLGPERGVRLKTLTLKERMDGIKVLTRIIEQDLRRDTPAMERLLNSRQLRAEARKQAIEVYKRTLAKHSHIVKDEVPLPYTELPFELTANKAVNYLSKSTLYGEPGMLLGDMAKEYSKSVLNKRVFYRGTISRARDAQADKQWFTSSKRAATSYMRYRGNIGDPADDPTGFMLGAKGNPEVVATYIEANNPLVLSSGKWHNTLNRIRERSKTPNPQQEYEQVLRKLGHDAVLINNKNGTTEVLVLDPKVLREVPLNTRNRARASAK